MFWTLVQIRTYPCRNVSFRGSVRSLRSTCRNHIKICSFHTTCSARGKLKTIDWNGNTTHGCARARAHARVYEYAWRSALLTSLSDEQFSKFCIKKKLLWFSAMIFFSHRSCTFYEHAHLDYIVRFWRGIRDRLRNGQGRSVDFLDRIEDSSSDKL